MIGILFQAIGTFLNLVQHTLKKGGGGGGMQNSQNSEVLKFAIEIGKMKLEMVKVTKVTSCTIT